MIRNVKNSQQNSTTIQTTIHVQQCIHTVDYACALHIYIHTKTNKHTNNETQMK